MKIGILSIYPSHNVGGILQLYALQKVLKERGHQVWVINRQKNRLPIWRLPLALFKRIALKYILLKKVDIFIEKTNIEKKKIMYSNTFRFISEYIQPQTFPIESKIDLLKMKKMYKFDCYIVGSDQVWRPQCLPVDIKEYYLSFTKNDNVRRIAYSASFGTSEWEYTNEQKKMCSKLVKKFNKISVREKTAVQTCKKEFGVDALHVLDPTMLLEKEDYVRILKNDNAKSIYGQLLIYFLDSRKENIHLIDIVAKELKIEPFWVNILAEDREFPTEKRIVPSVETWLKCFYEANYILTDSFHGTVFSMIFNKPFLVYANIQRGTARLQSLLEMFNLSERLIYSPSQIKKQIICKTINWIEVNNILNKYKKLSFEFLDRSLME